MNVFTTIRRYFIAWRIRRSFMRIYKFHIKNRINDPFDATINFFNTYEKQLSYRNLLKEMENGANEQASRQD